jgi:hypothetical protein
VIVSRIGRRRTLRPITCRGAIAFAALACCGRPAWAAEEVRVPIDAGGRVERIDAELARRAGLFAEVAGFRAAQVFALDDSTFVLEIEVDRAGKLVRDRRPLTPAAVAALRRDVDSRLAARPALDAEDRRGRPLLLAGTALLGLGFYDWALPAASDLDGKSAVAAGMFAAAGSFFVPWFLTRDAVVTPGMAHLALYGGTRGIVHGMLVHETANAHRVTADESDGRLFGGLAGSVLEGVGGYFWARGSRMDTGSAHAIGSSADFGLAYAMALAEVLDGDDTVLDGDEGGLQSAAGLAGAAGGVLGGRWLAAHRQYTWGDVEVARMAGLVGAAAGLAIADLSGTEDEDAWLGAGVLASAGGVVAGDRLVARTQYAPGEALLVDVGAVAGAALGLGLAYLLTDDNADVDSDSDPYTAAAALGAAGGFAITWATTRREAARHAAAGSDWQIDVQPLALLVSLRRTRGAAARWAPCTPIVRLGGTF